MKGDTLFGKQTDHFAVKGQGEERQNYVLLVFQVFLAGLTLWPNQAKTNHLK